jgi:hypothetical protein
MCRHPEESSEICSSAVVTQKLHVALASQYSFVSLLTRQTMMLFLTGPSGLMVASKLAGRRASRLASDVCRFAVILKCKGCSGHKRRMSCRRCCGFSFRQAFLPVLRYVLYAGTCALTVIPPTGNHPPLTTNTREPRR